MKATFIEREKNDVKFKIEFTKEEFENAQVKAYQKTKDQFRIDGFRPGKAPRKIIEARYGEGVFFEDAIDSLFQEFYPQALDELKLEVVAQPRAEFGKIEKNKPLEITLTVECEPEITVKGYKGVEIEKIEQKVSAKDVNLEIESMQKRNARMVLVERPAKNGDTLLLNYSGFVGDNQFEGGTAENQKLTLGSNTFIPGFEEQLVGVTPGEKKDVNVTFPKDYHEKSLAGKEAVFHCLVHEISEEQLPALDDDFAQDVSEYSTLDELKKETKKRLEKYAKEASNNKMKDAAILKVVEKNKVETPDSMVNEEIERTIQEIRQNLSYQGLKLEQYLEFTGKDMAALREEIKPEAERQVKTRLILQAIVKQENIEVSEEDLEKELKTMAEQYSMDVKKVREAIGEDNIKYFKKDLATGKAVDFIFNNAKIVEAKEKKAPAKKKEDK